MTYPACPFGWDALRVMQCLPVLLLAAAALAATASVPTEQAFAQKPGVTTIDVGDTALWVDISGDLAYVTNPADGEIIVVDASTGEVTNVIPSVRGIIVLEVVEDKDKMYATVEQYAPVIVYDLVTGQKIREIDIGNPDVTLYSKADKNYGQREYVTFTTNAVGLEYNPDTELLYAVHNMVNLVVVIDTRTDTVIDSIAVGKTPVMIAVDRVRNVGYVTNWETNNVSVLDLDTNTVTGSINTGFVPGHMAIDYIGDQLYVTHHASPHVTVIDMASQKVKTKIRLDGPTHAIAIDAVNRLVHVTYMPESGITGPGVDGKVEFINADTNEVVGDFVLPANPFNIAIDSDNQRLFATIINDGRVGIADLTDLQDYQDIISSRASAEAQPGGGCLIATAAHGTELAPQVQLLREVRDNVILETQSGAAFLSGFNHLYYSFSPTIADLERENPIFRYLVGALVTPLLYSLHIMTLTDGSSESTVVLFGLAVIALNIVMYVVAPVWIGLVLLKRIKSSVSANPRYPYLKRLG